MGELETEARKTRGEIASYLRELAVQLDGDEDVRLELGGKQVVLNPTEPVTRKLEGESDWFEGDTEVKQSIEIELVWWREATSQNDGETGDREQGDVVPSPAI
jgi:amphi-Trp domain-containing protein